MKTLTNSTSESIQTIYNNYVEKRYVVNRKYQRKLVWTLDEKEAFIDSIVNQFSVPLFLMAQYVDANNEITYEIIDGMQRLNAITSFIENEFAVSYNGQKQYFDLETLASTLLAKNEKRLVQRKPILPKEICQSLVVYKVPFSYVTANEHDIEEIFRRINSFGRRLSNQEIRQAGAVGLFPDMVRTIASYIRGDVSPDDKLNLSEMHKISLSNVKLKYGILLDNVWWVSQHIITTANMRISRDEELIALLLAYIILGKNTQPSSKELNRLYKYNVVGEKNQTAIALKVEAAIRKIGTESIIKKFANAFSTLLSVLKAANKDFTSLIFNEDEIEGTVRSFQIIFLAFYEVLYVDNRIIIDEEGVINDISNIRDTVLGRITSRKWNAEERYRRIQQLKAIITKHTKHKDREDVAADDWSLLVDSIMRKSKLEGSQYDFKAGFHNFADGKLNADLIGKCVKTLTAAVNKGPRTKSYIVVGICESRETYEQFKSHYKTKVGEQFEDTNFYITGIDEEVKKYYSNNYDKIQNEIISIIEKEPINVDVKNYILTHMIFPKYYDRVLLVMELESSITPVTYNDKYYERHGNNNKELSGISEIKALEARFQKS